MLGYYFPLANYLFICLIIYLFICLFIYLFYLHKPTLITVVSYNLS